MVAQFAINLNYQVVHCCECGMPFGLNEDFYKRAVNDGRRWYCPLGHGQHFIESENTKLKKELELERHRTQWARESANMSRKRADKAEHSRNAIRGHFKKLKKRVTCGVCPCCSRSFQNLKRHIATKHPAYSEENGD